MGNCVTVRGAGVARHRKVFRFYSSFPLSFPFFSILIFSFPRGGTLENCSGFVAEFSGDEAEMAATRCLTDGCGGVAKDGIRRLENMGLAGNSWSMGTVWPIIYYRSCSITPFGLLFRPGIAELRQPFSPIFIHIGFKSLPRSALPGRKIKPKRGIEQLLVAVFLRRKDGIGRMRGAE